MFTLECSTTLGLLIHTCSATHNLVALLQFIQRTFPRYCHCRVLAGKRVIHSYNFATPTIATPSFLPQKWHAI